jgi:N-acetylglucosamine repressor
MRKTGGLKLMQEINQFIVLETIRNHGPISRSDVAKKVNLSPTTVTSAVNELLENGLVVIKGTGKSNGGRKPVFVQFAPDSKYLICVSITNTEIIIGTANLEAEVKSKKVYPIRLRTEKQVIDYTLSCIEEYISNIDNLSMYMGISVITPGIVDSKRGFIRMNAKLGLQDIALKDLIEERFSLRTWIDNDANAIALAEMKYGLHGDKKNLIYIQLGEGLGSGIVLQESIFRGTHGGAGEFGHISIDREGILCECGNIGCLENYVSWPAVYSKILSSINKGKQTMLLDDCRGDVTSITQETFFNALEKRDELALEIAEETAGYLANGIVTLVNLFNPDVILIGWETIKSDSYFMNIIREKVKKYAFNIFTDGLQIQTTTLGIDYQLKGAASIALQEIFEVPL